MPGFHRGNRREKLADRELSLLYSNRPDSAKNEPGRKIMWFVSSIQRYT
jgi:hypothetical protein